MAGFVRPLYVALLVHVASFAHAAVIDLSFPRHVDRLPNADIDGDGHLDCVWVEPRTGTTPFRLCWARRLGPWQFAAAQSFPLNVPAAEGDPSLDFDDFDGDGRLDPCLSFRGGTGCSAGSQILCRRLYGTPVFQTFDTSQPITRVPFDADGDGDRDLAVSTVDPMSCSNEIKLFVDDGSGHYGPGAAYPGSFPPATIAIADLNGDHRPDIVTPGAAGYLPNAGSGIFGLRVPIALSDTDREFYFARARDVNTDGRIDLVLISHERVHVALNAQSAFRDTIFYTASTSAAAFDLDADGGEDYVLDSPYTPDSWTLLRHIASNVFIIDTLGPRLSGSVGIVSADFNGDDRPDFLSAGTVAFRLFLSQAPDSWMAGRVYSVPLTGATTVDYDEDLSPDVISAAAGGGYDVFRGQPGGDVIAPIRFDLIGDGRTIAIGDVDGDGRNDAIVSRADGFAWSAGSGRGDFGAAHPFTWSMAGLQTRALALVDLNDDDLLDLVAARQSLGSAGDLAIVLNNGGGTLAPETSVASGIRPTAVVVRDFDRDGLPDLLVNDTAASALILFGLGGGVFATPIPVAAGAAGALAAGDFNGDGRLDFAAHVFEGTNVVLNAGNRTFGAPTLVPTTAGARFGLLLAADVDRNGRSDLLVAGGSSFEIAKSLPDGTFTPATPPPGLARTVLDVAVSDFDLDGNADLGVIVPDGLLPTSIFRVYRGLGDGNFEPQGDIPSSGSVFAAGQVAGDAKPDVLLASILLINQTPGTTPVTIQGLAAAAVGDHVQVTWSIAPASLRDIVGVEVQKAGAPAGPFETLTTRPLPASGSMMFEDPAPRSAGVVWYRLELVLTNGARETSPAVAIQPRETTTRTRLEYVGPGALPGSSEVRFVVAPSTQQVDLAIYDVRGHVVAALESGRISSGSHVRLWDGSTTAGARAARGVYFVGLAADGRREVRRLVIRNR